MKTLELVFLLRYSNDFVSSPIAWRHHHARQLVRLLLIVTKSTSVLSGRKTFLQKNVSCPCGQLHIWRCVWFLEQELFSLLPWRCKTGLTVDTGVPAFFQFMAGLSLVGFFLPSEAERWVDQICECCQTEPSYVGKEKLSARVKHEW